MNAEQSFSPDERHRIIELVKAIVSLPTFSGDEKQDKVHSIRNVKNYFAAAISESQDSIKRDAFGFSPLIISLEAALILGEEIGLDETAMLGCIISSVPLAKSVPVSTFGPEIERIVTGIHHSAELFEKWGGEESDNFRSLLISSAGDMRVVIILIARSLALMRRLRDVPEEEARAKESRKAGNLYASIAHKLGLYKVKSELEDLSLKYLDREAYYMIRSRLNATKAARDAYIASFIAPIEQKLSAASLAFRIKGRTKSIHSIYQKMKRQHCGFDGVYDLFAIRIIITCPQELEKQQCWQVYSIITDMYQPNPKRLRDWLSVPKSNGYESLHTTVLGPGGKWVEVQIRSERMDVIAEYGLAAHWRYKGIKSGEGGLEEWLSKIRTSLESHGNRSQALSMSGDFASNPPKEQEVFVFTPRGDLDKFPAGATVLDFAFRIHSSVGCHCIGARIGGKNYSLRHQLTSGDQVEILLSSSQSPGNDWLNYVVTSRAKSKIRQALHEKAVKEGQYAREAFERKIAAKDIPWDESIMSRLARKCGYKEMSAFFKAIANSEIQLNDAEKKYVALYKEENDAHRRLTDIHAGADSFNLRDNNDAAYTDQKQDELVIDNGVGGVEYTLAKCCHPIYGDEIFGFVTSGGGIKIHRKGCPNANMLMERFPYRIIPAKWAGKRAGKYIITLRVVGNDNIGIVNNMTSVIGKTAGVTLRSIRIDSGDGLFSGILTIEAESASSQKYLTQKLGEIHGVKSVTRM